MSDCIQTEPPEATSFPHSPLFSPFPPVGLLFCLRQARFQLCSTPTMTRQTRSYLLSALFLAALVAVCVFLGWFWKVRPQHRYDEFINAAAQRYNLDPALIKAVIWQESRFDRYARGKAGEIGLMQVCEPAALEWADHEKFSSFDHEEITDPQKNILCGSFYLSKLLKRYTQTDNPLPYALADYN